MVEDNLKEGGDKAGKGFWQSIWDGMKSAYNSVKDWVVNSVNWLRDNPVKWLEDKASWVKTKGEQMVNDARSYWDRAMNWVSGVLGFATGGPVPGPRGQAVPAILHGGEYVIPANGSLVASGTNGGNQIVVDMAGANISSPDVAEEYAEIIGNKIIDRLSKVGRGYV
jgi:hypothetical protein